MSVEFMLGHQDHQKVEDFLSGGPAGVGAITLHSTYAKHQQAAAEAARDLDLDVLYDPRTERLAYEDPNAATAKLPGRRSAPLDVAELAKNPHQRTALVSDVLAGHPTLATVVTPPSFFVTDELTGLLNVSLAEETRIQSDRAVRAKLLVSSRVNRALLEGLADEYVRAGIREIDLRLSPLNGENDGVRKIRLLFESSDLFRDRGMRVILGSSGNIGQVAYALGHAHAYSGGIGQEEHVDHAGKISRQRTPVKRDADGKKIKSGGGWEGIYLPGLAVTVSKSQGEALLANTNIRSRIGCRTGVCGTSIQGPLLDSKAHYLHSRAQSMAVLERQPEAWRGTTELSRLERAIELRNLINEHHQVPGHGPLKTRTLSSLVTRIQEEAAAA